MKMDTCYCPVLFIVDVVIINNILLARNKCQHIIIIKDFFLSYQCLTKSFSPISKGYFFASPLNLCLSAYVAEHWLTDTLSIHLFFCVGVQSNTLSRLWFLEGNKNPTQLNLTQEDIKNVSFSLWIQLIKLLAALPVFYSYNQGYANKWIIKLLNT